MAQKISIAELEQRQEELINAYNSLSKAINCGTDSVLLSDDEAFYLYEYTK